MYEFLRPHHTSYAENIITDLFEQQVKHVADNNM